MKKLSEKQRIIQEQAKLIREKEKESSTDATSAKDKEILVRGKWGYVNQSSEKAEWKAENNSRTS